MKVAFATLFAVAAADTCSLYKIAGGSCGQSDLECIYKGVAKENGFADGTCPGHGYSFLTGKQTKYIPGIGDIVITTYGQALQVGELEAEKQPLESSVNVGISMSQIANYWISKHSKDNCQTAVAVAMAESSGNCGASHTNSGGTIDRGLWQINDYYHPECSDSCAYDCACNAGCAVSVWKSSGWSAWATWKAGAHQKYMNDAAAACGYSSEELEKDTLAASLQVGYSPDAAVSWADSHCASGSSQCAEFASEAIKAGGHANGCWSTWVPDLDSCLKSNAGWKKTSFPCSKGCVVIWQDSQGPYHAAISRGGGSIDQHNPNRCQSSGSWGDNYCWCPPSFTVTANETSEVMV